MNIFAVFETWHIGDGNYPALRNGQLVNLSFEMEPDELVIARQTVPQRFHHTGQAKYEFTGTVLRVYNGDDTSDRIVVVEADGFRFYINSSMAGALTVADAVSGRGTLALDHYLWVEFLSSYADPPDLFYKLRVSDICRMRLPERFITRLGPNTAYPTRLPAKEYGQNDVTHVENIEDEPYTFYVVEFTDEDIPAGAVPRTFQ